MTPGKVSLCHSKKGPNEKGMKGRRKEGRGRQAEEQGKQLAGSGQAWLGVTERKAALAPGWGRGRWGWHHQRVSAFNKAGSWQEVFDR